MLRLLLAFALFPLFVGLCLSQETKPAPIAATRWALKETLEAHKNAKPRLDPPPTSDEDKAKGRSNAGQGGMRKLLDAEIRANWPRDWLDENMPLTKAMRNELLWVTSRVNNCLY
jgi:hypothetical protein